MNAIRDLEQKRASILIKRDEMELEYDGKRQSIQTELEQIDVEIEIRMTPKLQALWSGMHADYREILRPFLNDEESFKRFFIEVYRVKRQSFLARSKNFAPVPESQIGLRIYGLKDYLRDYFLISYTYDKETQKHTIEFSAI